MANQHTKAKDREAQFLEVMRKRFKLGMEASAESRDEALEDINFRAGNQWPADIKSRREAQQKPCLTINRLPQFERQITNDIRQNRPAINVNPVDDKADPETAEVLQGLIRHIEYDSHADVAYDRAATGAVRGGFGYMRVVTEYAHAEGFEQDIKIKSILDPFMVVFDPNSTEPDGSDAKWAFVFEDMAKEEFEGLYPDAEVCSKGWDYLALSGGADWMQGEKVRVAEYFWIEDKTKRDLYLLADGSIVEELPEGAEVVKRRQVMVPTVHWVKTNGVEVLERTTIPCDWIPVIPVYGDEIVVDGKRVLEGAFRHARDPQRMFNYWASMETQTIALAPKAPFIAAEGQLDDYRAQWERANQDDLAYLVYKPTSIAGTVIGPPQRNLAEPPIMAITQARLQCSDDLKATTGIYDASLGARSNEQSGRAIRARQQQGQISNFHFVDNLTRSIRHLGRILVNMIPRIYDTDRVVRVLGIDGQAKLVPINREFVDERRGVRGIYDLTVGKYDVTVQAGPNYQTKRQEAVAGMETVIQAAPQLMGVAGDLLVKNMDWPGAEELAKRLKKMLPPQLQEPEDGQKRAVDPAAQAQMQQMGQMLDQLTAALNEAQGRVMQSEQALNEAQGMLKNKDQDLALKAGEIQMKGELEAEKLRIDEQKLMLDAEKLRIEQQKLELEELRIMADAVKSQMPKESPEPQGEEAEQPAQAMSREDLAVLFSGMVQALAANQAPPPPMPPQQIVLKQTPGGLVGEIHEVTPNHEVMP